MRSSHANEKSTSFEDDIFASSAPSPTRAPDFKGVHEEMAVLQNVGRVFLGVTSGAMGEGKGSRMSWARFVTVPTFHRTIASDDQIETFLMDKVEGG